MGLAASRGTFLTERKLVWQRVKSKTRFNSAPKNPSGLKL